MRLRLVQAFIIFIVGCSSSVSDTFNSKELTSSKGEKIYINSLNWGMTDDNQMTIITSDSKRLNERSDTVNVVYGLEPFVYRFENDTLKLFFMEGVQYTVKEKFETIGLQYISLDREEFKKIKKRSYDNDGYYSVPMRKKANYPSDMPKPPKQ